VSAYTPVNKSLPEVWEKITKATVHGPTILTDTQILHFVSDDKGWIVVAYQSAEPGVIMILDHRAEDQPAQFVSGIPENIIHQLQ
jgi:hypothetical protein